MSIERTYNCDGPENPDIPSDAPQPDGAGAGTHADLIAEALASPVGHWEEVAALAAALAEADRQLVEKKRRIEDLEEGAWPWEWMIATRERERWKAAEAALKVATDALKEIGQHSDSRWARNTARLALVTIRQEPQP